MAEAKGFTIDCIPFISTRPLPEAEVSKTIQDLAHREIYVLFTSVQAVQATFKLLNQQPRWKAFVLSGATKTEVEKYLPENALLAHAIDAKNLAPLILEHSSVKQLYFFCGKQHSTVIPQALIHHGRKITECIVYETIVHPQKIQQDYDAYLFFSPTAVKSFAQDNSIKAHAPVFTIGNTTGNAVQQLTTGPVIKAGFPSEEQVLQNLFDFFKPH